MLRLSRKLVVGILISVALSACSGLPRGGALEREILKTRNEPTTDIAVYPVTRAFLPTAKLWPSTGEKACGWIGSTPAGQEDADSSP